MTAASGAPRPRGEMIDIGGRRLRLVCEGPGDAAPVVILESGAFGIAADWAVVQDRLAARGMRSCAYDRAGMGFSDPGPSPRDGIATAEDLEKLLAAAHIPAPYILVGHSMAGLRVRLFAVRHPDRTAGVVLVDATTPEATQSETAQGFIRPFVAISRLAGLGASVGLLRPFEFSGDTIGLPPEAAAEKRWAFGDGRHNRTSAEEVAAWNTTAAQARAAGPFDPTLPVAVVTAGSKPTAWKTWEERPARDSHNGYYVNVPGAAHATLLGPKYADEIVKGVLFVRDAAAARAAAPAPG